MKKVVKDYVATCQIYQKNKYEALALGGLLQPLPISDVVWAKISMDFISELPKAKGKDTILVVVDRLMKFVHFIALARPFAAKEVAQVFIREVIRLYGFPQVIVLDQDQLFLNHFWADIFKQASTKLKYSTSYHPQIDGQTKVVNQCLETFETFYEY